MVKRIVFPLLLLLLLSGCGASAPMATAPCGSAQITNGADSASTGAMETAPEYGMDQPHETEAPGQASPAEGERDGGNYFLFERGNTILTEPDGLEILHEYTCDVIFHSSDPEQNIWVNAILEEIHREYEANSSNLLNYAREHLMLNGKEGFLGYSNYQEVGITRHDEKIVSLLVLSSIYSGGVHPNSVQTAWNLDMERNTVLGLEDVLCEGAAEKLAETVQYMVAEKFQAFGTDALFADYQHTIAGAFQPETMTPYWYLNDVGLVIFFNQYTLGPYAAGIIKLEIPYTSLGGVLLEEYFPNEEAFSGDLFLRSDWEGSKQIQVVVNPDGLHIPIGVEGMVSQLQLSEVLWLEGNAIGQKMLFSADRMDKMDVLVLIGGFDEDGRSFALEFQNGTRNKMIYYVHPDGLSEEP